MDFPVPLISDILSRLPVDDVARCRCVCKCWNELATEPHFAYLHWTKSSETFRQGDADILLYDSVFDTPKNGNLYLVSNRFSDRTMWTSLKIPSLEDDDIRRGRIKGSCNGLLCLEVRRKLPSFPNLVYNPITRTQITLPELEAHPNYYNEYTCGFGFDQVNRKYKVVIIYFWGDNTDGGHVLRAMGAILTVGENTWRPLQIPAEVDGVIYNRDPLFFSETFSWVITRIFGSERLLFDGFLHLDVNTEKFQIIKFSPSLELPISLDLIQMGDSVALASLKQMNAHRFISTMDIGPPSLEIWKILGANTDGSCRYEYTTFSVQIETSGRIDIKTIKLLSVLGNSSFLLNALQVGPADICDHLVICDSEKNECSTIEVAGIPDIFSFQVLSPSFISPTL